jgi:hypothetical protein
VEEITLLGQHVADIAGPHRDRQHHHIHGREGRNGEAPQQEARLLGLLGLRAFGLERIGLVAELGEAIDEARRIERALLPFQRDAAVGQVHARQRHIGERRQTALDLGHAAGATNALDSEIDVLQSGAEIPDIMREVARRLHCHSITP